VGLVEGTIITPSPTGLDRQYVSAALATQTLNNFTMTGQILCKHLTASDNVQQFRICGVIVSNDGTTIRSPQLLTLVTAHGTITNLNTAYRNKSIAGSGGTYTPNVSVTAGDRLVLEVGWSHALGTTPEARAKWGVESTDLPIDETTTTDLSGWIEFSQTILFQTVFDYTGTTALQLGGSAITQYAAAVSGAKVRASAVRSPVLSGLRTRQLRNHE
jgi:hypothetical protein